MGILTRFKDIMSANINSLLDKCENPSKMIDEYMRQVTEQLADVKKETAGIIAEEKRTKRQIEENNEQISKYDNLARKALTAGNEEDAKVFLEKKQEYTNLGVDLQKSYDIAHENANKMREMHDKLTKDVQTLEQRRKNVHSKISVAKTQDTINKVTGSMDSTASSMRAFEKMEEKAERMLDMADATSELNEQPADLAKELETKYSTTSESVENELNKLKQEMGMQ